jgi:hypothetical protein
MMGPLGFLWSYPRRIGAGADCPRGTHGAQPFGWSLATNWPEVVRAGRAVLIGGSHLRLCTQTVSYQRAIRRDVFPATRGRSFRELLYDVVYFCPVSLGHARKIRKNF